MLQNENSFRFYPLNNPRSQKDLAQLLTILRYFWRFVFLNNNLARIEAQFNECDRNSKYFTQSKHTIILSSGRLHALNIDRITKKLTQFTLKI